MLNQFGWVGIIGVNIGKKKMFTHIRMKNFKSWKDSGEVKLAPLTGFFGTNSSGKSSLLQMLLLLKQTAERSDIEERPALEVLFFGDGGSLVNLGDFREVIHGHKEEESLELAFGCELRDPHSIDFSVEDREPLELKIDNFTFKTVVKKEYRELIVQNVSYISFSDSWKIEWERELFDNRLPDGWQSINGTSAGRAEVQNCYGTPMPEKWRGPQVVWNRKFLRQISSVFENLFSQMYYLGPTRVHPQRYYHWEGTHPKKIDLWGNKAIDALLSAGVRKLKSSTKENGVLIETRISEWLQKIELAHSFQLIPTGSLEDKNYEVRIRKTANSAEVTLGDMGHGVSDLFPLLVHCYYVSEGSTLILEQPGIHLHPKAQAHLADLLIEVITERNLQILIESHSEHLLNRLQRRIAEEKISTDQTALYFCRNDKGVSTIERLAMDEFGNIANWPENFFGDEMGDLFAMTEAQRERQKKTEGE